MAEREPSRWCGEASAAGARCAGSTRELTPTPEEAAEAIDKSTLVLLFAVMGMGAFLAIDGFFDRAAPRLAHLARAVRLVQRAGRPPRHQTPRQGGRGTGQALHRRRQPARAQRRSQRVHRGPSRRFAVMEHGARAQP